MHSEILKLIFLLIVSNFFINYFFIKIFKFFKFYDLPDNNLKFHTSKVPYAGGTIIYTNFAIIFFYVYFYFENTIFFPKEDFMNIFIISTIVFIIGLFDDIFKLSSSLRLVLLTVFIIFFLSYENDYLINKISFSFIEKKISLIDYSIFITTLCFLLFIQAFNMLDGINLQAGLYSFVLFLFSSSVTLNELFFLSIPIIFSVAVLG